MNAHENGQWLWNSGGTTENDDANDIAKSHIHFSDTLYYILQFFRGNITVYLFYAVSNTFYIFIVLSLTIPHMQPNAKMYKSSHEFSKSNNYFWFLCIPTISMFANSK